VVVLPSRKFRDRTNTHHYGGRNVAHQSLRGSVNAAESDRDIARSNGGAVARAAVREIAKLIRARLRRKTASLAKQAEAHATWENKTSKTA